MIKLIQSFLKWFLNLKPINAICQYVGDNVVGATSNAVKNYAIRGVAEFWAPVLGILLFIIAVICVLRVFGIFSRGNRKKYNPDRLDKIKKSPLSGKNIVFLGSSVTKGFAAYGKSFVDMIAARTGANCVKEAVSGTTLVDDNAKSYVARLKALDPKTPCDLFVCQLSTNDATKKKPLGKVATAGEAFDTKTVCGAIEYIIDYAKKTWNCPIAFYTNPEYASPEYKDMVDALYEIAKKWNISIIDLWNNETVHASCHKRPYMNDQIHPTKLGYTTWLPIIENALNEIVSGKNVIGNNTLKIKKDELKKQKSKKSIRKALKYVLAAILAFALFCFGCGITQAFVTLGVFKPSNAKEYSAAAQTMKEDSPLKGKKILFLGSSVVEGAAARRDGPGEYIAAVDGAVVVKSSYSGTTIAYQDDRSYAPRLMTYTKADGFDAVVIQLSTNDAGQGVVRGEISESYNPVDFDQTTFCGAMEAMLEYCKNTLQCPAVVFTVTSYGQRDDMFTEDNYDGMVQVTKKLCEKWGAHLLNMWEDEELNNITKEQFNDWMANGSHPVRKGYLEWWLPEFEKALYPLFE